MDLNEDETMDDAEDYEDTLQGAYDHDSEIDGDCNESQPVVGMNHGFNLISTDI